MVLSDRDIKKGIAEGLIAVEPFDIAMVQPASVDLRLGNKFLTFRSSSRGAIDVKEPVDDIMEEVLVEEGVPFVLHPGEFVLGVTFEKVGLSAGIVGQLNGKSSLGRLGIIVHATAGFIDPGNHLKPTLELHNIGKLPVNLYWKMPIAQISFTKLSSEAEEPYGAPTRKSKYFGDEGPTASKMHLNF
ncbi:MAG: dCTP deaminase [Candidatus Terrybacteria bacterium RIFCSPHIGHO2_01_FULL_48_17]|uniref:dCTP deaminase, dUMP-forming n=1 Tax=Candidatus Terrybacteria bacterium RIFCSPHIGHO2_01_FULL_48_17 TaxID=1802362 RepID=A0A1G2PJU7_9BACT|nr:MAG: dCTP deaminase [Candidatus Terrybacteria bacterium RIFCSPHIGHO2_01_FULL_48_17]OHA52989.1 MAG: dCTP deaminase [Candidatus Terrybacteria bacterium RIFCSPLOWO2_01_FULL_48_14]